MENGSSLRQPGRHFLQIPGPTNVPDRVLRAIDETVFRQLVLDRFNLSLGSGLGKLKGRAFRIGHLGDFNDLMLCGTLCGVEMGLSVFGVPFHKGGVNAAMEFLGSGR